MVQAVYGYSYPPFLPRRVDPKAEEFYRALLVFADYWNSSVADFSSASLPDNGWIDMSRHAFAKELMIRPGGVYPKYSAVDRDYFGSEYDGFQDIFTMAAYTQLEWGRFVKMARKFIDNYFTDFVDDKGMVNMRGPETAQFRFDLVCCWPVTAITLAIAELIAKHRRRFRATAKPLAELHDESLRLPQTVPATG